MLTENTGKHMLDSGGAYGRHWERNQKKSFHIRHSKNSFILAETLEPCSVKLYEGSQILSLVSCTVVPEPLACDFNNISLYLDRL